MFTKEELNLMLDVLDSDIWDIKNYSRFASEEQIKEANENLIKEQMLIEKIKLLLNKEVS